MHSSVSCFARQRIRFALCFALLFAGCAEQPRVPQPGGAVPTQCLPPTAVPRCADTLPGSATIAEPAPAAAPGRLARSEWNALPAWSDGDIVAALGAFVKGCPVLADRSPWKDACERAALLASSQSPAEVTRFFRDTFEPYQVINADQTVEGMVTGYYEPLLFGSRRPSHRYRYPIYRVPQDLLTIDLSSVYPEFKDRRLRGRIEGDKVVPYFSRAEIETESPRLKGLELVWVDDAVDLFFLHIQGSGQVQLEGGERMHIGYADQNGHPFRSLGGALIRKGEIKPERASMQGIKEWARRHPRKVQEFMNLNPSYVFFKELPGDLSGPIGTLGVPLTAERSIAVDPRVIPLGVPVYLSTTWPSSDAPLNRLMVAQDTGGAINGAVRADFYWGFGEEAGKLAGRMKQPGRMWVLLPRGYDPNSLTGGATSLPP